MRDLLEINPIIASVKNDEAIEKVIKSDCEIVFLLNGDIITLKNKIQYIQKHNKKVFVHIDMISGISASPIIVDYVKKELNLDGIITTKSNIVKRAIELNIDVIQRFFFIDSISVDNAIESLKKVKPKAIEIMPGIVPKIVKRLNKAYPNISIICGGLIDEKEEMINALSSGALAVSVSNDKMW